MTKLSPNMIDALRFILGDRTPGLLFTAATMKALVKRGLLQERDRAKTETWDNAWEVPADKMAEAAQVVQVAFPGWELPRDEKPAAAPEPVAQAPATPVKDLTPENWDQVRQGVQELGQEAEPATVPETSLEERRQITANYVGPKSVCQCGHAGDGDGPGLRGYQEPTRWGSGSWGVYGQGL
jgi:hypothetical protein